MKQLKILPLVAIISGVMVGCGGGSGGSSGGGAVPAPKYTWQMINLYATEQSNVATGCVIYDEQEGNTGKVITARVADRGFNVLYHNADGSVITEYTIDDIPSTGKVTIDTGLVPEDGYVSVEEVSGLLAGDQEVYMFTVQKEFLSNMVVNVRTAQSSSNVCYQGEQNYSEVSEDAVVSVRQRSADTSYYQSSYIDMAVDGHQIASDIPVQAPLQADKKVLITAFDTYESGKYSDLMHYVFADASSIYDVNNPPASLVNNTMVDVEYSDVNFSVTGIALNDEGNSVNLGFNKELYLWQPIYPSTTVLSFDGANIAANGWTVELSGKVESGDWNYHSLTAYNGLDLNLDAPYVSSFTSSSSSCGDATNCLNTTGYTDSEFDIQRTHIRSVTRSGNAFYQTIFSKPSNSQVLMESSSEEVLDLGDSDRVEVSIASLDSDDSQSVMYFIENNHNIQSVITGSSPDFTDLNGSVSTATQIKNRKVAMMSENVTILENSAN